MGARDKRQREEGTEGTRTRGSKPKQKPGGNDRKKANAKGALEHEGRCDERRADQRRAPAMSTRPQCVVTDRRRRGSPDGGHRPRIPEGRLEDRPQRRALGHVRHVHGVEGRLPARAQTHGVRANLRSGRGSQPSRCSRWSHGDSRPGARSQLGRNNLCFCWVPRRGRRSSSPSAD